MKITYICLLALLSKVSPSFAAEYSKLVPEKSVISFTYEQMGVSMTGSFDKFDGQIMFDTASPEQAKVNLEVDMASVNTGSSENDTEVSGKDWFDTQSFPKAYFKITKVSHLDENLYQIEGDLTIKGITRPLKAPVRYTPKANSGVFEGTFTLKRQDYAIGQGEWSSFDVVANDISINVRIYALATN